MAERQRERALLLRPRAAAPVFQKEDKEGRVKRELCLQGQKGKGLRTPQHFLPAARARL